jgi:lysophospholipase L1-like esterase
VADSRDAWLGAVVIAAIGAVLVTLLLSPQAPWSPPPAPTSHRNAQPAGPTPSQLPPAPTSSRTAEATTASASAAPKPRRRRPYYIAAIGDSLTDPKSHGGKYLDIVQQRCPKTRIDNYGRGADMVNQMRRRFLSTVLPSPNRYTHLVVFGGVNDLYSDKTAGRTPEKVARDLLDMYSKASQRGMRIVALTVAPWGGFTRYYNAKRGADTRKLNQWIRDQFDVGTVQHVVDAYALLSCGRPEYLCGDYSVDGIHFNARGHEVLGEELFKEAFADCE